MLFRYAHAIERRLFLLEEVGRLERSGRTFPRGFRRRLWRSPSWAEDWVNLACFVPPSQAVFLIDVGANIGEFSKDFLWFYSKAKVLALEPTSGPFAQLSATFEATRTVNCLQLAASDTNGCATINLAEEATFSSLEKYSADAIDSSNEVGTEVIEKVRIDTLSVPDDVGEIVLKIDVQGHELEAVRGAEGLLPKIACCLVETSFANEFEGKGPTFSVICELMRAADLWPAVFQEAGGKSTYGVERDVIFVRQDLLPRLWHHNY